MAEIEIHHEHEHGPADALGKRVGLMVGVIGVILAVVTIAAHREHTTAVIERTAENDQWAYYQAKKIREHMSEVGDQLALALGTDPAKVEAAARKFESMAAKYRADAEEVQKEARERHAATARAEHRALRFDLGEGFLELGLVLCSLYFLGRHRAFPLFGGIAALVGLVTALTALVF